MTSSLSNIIDLSIAIPETDTADVTSLSQRFDISDLSLSELSLPSLDLDSTCTDNSFSDQSESVDDQYHRQAVRSIFGAFWDKQKRLGQPEKTKSFSLSSVNPSSENTCTKSAVVPLSLQIQKTSSSVVQSPITRRRSIFQVGVSSQSSPSLSIEPLKHDPVIRSASSMQSLPDIDGRLLKPCLRRSSYSSDGCNMKRTRSASTSDASSVSFSPNVNVIVYQKPKEFYSSDNWSSFFE
jgi:hypothetical protein